MLEKGEISKEDYDISELSPLLQTKNEKIFIERKKS